MPNEITIRFSGEQGSGVQYTGQLMTAYLTSLGYRIFAINDFESRIKGGYSFVQIRIALAPIHSLTRSPALSLLFSSSVLEKDLTTLSPQTVIFLPQGSSSEALNNFQKYFINFQEVLTKEQKPFINTFFIALVAGLLRTDLEILKNILLETLQKKGTEVIDRNLEVAERGFKYASTLNINQFILEKPKEVAEGIRAVSGSFALSMGAALSNCKFYAAYPMSPSTAIINNLSDWANDFGLITEQGEDEIAVINLGLGASYAGVRAMIGTSGGGLALMSESVSLAALTEVPLVIVDAQRPAPATGLPTRTEQADLLFTLFIGHGEFTRVILAPGNPERGAELTQKAFYLADKYQIPVFILTDQYFMDSLESAQKFSLVEKYQERFLSREQARDKPYLRYEFTPNGVSQRYAPGFQGFAVVADSHTHEESGLITEDSGFRKKNVEKLLSKKTAVLEDISPPYVSQKEAGNNVVIGWGSTFGVIKDAVNILKEKGFSLTHIHYEEIYPFAPSPLKNIIASAKKIIVVENNAWGQFGLFLKMEAEVKVEDPVLKYDGRPFYTDELVGELERRLIK